VEKPSSALVAAFQVAGLAAAALLLPAVLIDLALDTDFLSILSQGALAAFAIALIVAIWKSRQQT
jgi:hypothetical protein